MNANPDTPPEAAEIPLLSAALLNLAGAQFLTGIWSVWDRCPNRGAARNARAIKIELQGRDLRTEAPDRLGSQFRNASATALLRSPDHVINTVNLSMEAGEYTTTGMRNMPPLCSANRPRRSHRLSRR
jgi:hypothetical protein